MKSKASIKGHPLHPMLIPFPIAFLVGGTVFDFLATWLDHQNFAMTAQYLIIAGIGCGLLAAIPGIIDFLYTVPPKSSGKKRGVRHMLLILSMLIVYGAAIYLRPRGIVPLWLLVLEGVGLLLLSAAGWQGGTLAYRNQIGVDHRYANKGRWKEITVAGEVGTFTEIPGAEKLEVGHMLLVRFNGRRIVIARTKEGFRAFDDRCTHRGGSLAGGILACGTVTCPWHGAQFDTSDGKVLAGPAQEKIIVHQAKEEGNRVSVKIE